jgi:nucleotide-binding universal stress UspA family protein
VAPSHVLVPLDGSPLAEEALEHAFETFDCPITVVNVVLPFDAPMSEGGLLGADDERLDAAREYAENVIKLAGERAAEADRPVEVIIETGDPADAILQVVEEQNVDHIVMGGHSEDTNRVARRLLGTVATAVVGESPVPVTVVK